MDVIVITSPDEVAEEHSIVHEMFRAGLRTLHIRKPDFSMEEMQEYLEKIPRKYLKRIVLHSHHSLARKFNLKGIHLKEADKHNRFDGWSKILAYKVLPPFFSVSASFHKTEEFKENGPVYNYVFMSPVFDSISKADYKPKYNLRKLYEALKLSKYKVYALGGIDEDKIELVREVGFDGVAVLGAIWFSEDPVQKFKNIRDICKNKHPLY